MIQLLSPARLIGFVAGANIQTALSARTKFWLVRPAFRHAPPNSRLDALLVECGRMGADASGFEEDARLTAMCLWTLKTGDANGVQTVASEEDSSDEKEGGGKKACGGFVLEFDAARKIAQGLGAHLEDLQSLVEVAGETALLLPVAERARHLFGTHEGKAATVRKKRRPQMELFDAGQQVAEAESSFGETKIEHVGATVLDRIHQSMILFAAGRGDALKHFLIEDGTGQDQRFWRLAQALSALYPSHTEEKRWVDGVLARKKGLGL